MTDSTNGNSSTNGNKNYIFPTMRAVMGDREYFISVLTFSDIKDWIKHIDEIHERKEFKTWLQRKLTPKRREEIAKYLCTQDQHFFNAIVVGIYRGEPDWFPVTFDNSERFNELQEQGANKGTLGFLKLTGDEDIFAIDGQHRVEGIKRAIELNKEVGEDQQCVIFVAHKTDEEGHKRTRRLFSTLNRYAKPVSRGEIVALSEDDAFAIVTRKLTEDFDLLQGEIIEFTTETNIPPNNTKCITTILALYEVVKILALPKNRIGSRQRKELEVGPPDDKKIQEIYNQQTDFWEELKANFIEIRNVASGKKTAGDYRKPTGGHLLFRPVGLKPFAGALRILLDKNFSLKQGIKALSKVPLSFEKPPWKNVLWDSEKLTVITGNEVLAQNMFLHLLGQDASSGKKPYNLKEKYQKTVGENDTTFEELPILDMKKI